MKHIRTLALLLTLLLLGAIALPGMAEEAEPFAEEIELTAPPAEDDLEVVAAPSDAEIAALEEDELEIVAPPEEDEALSAESPFIIEDGILTAYTGEEADVVLPEDVTVIAAYAFADNAALVSVSCPDGLQAIEDYAFAGCASLERVDAPEGCTLGELAFAGSALDAEPGIRSRKAVITKQPDDIMSPAGETATVTIAASGKNLSYEWQVLPPTATSWTTPDTSSARQRDYQFTATADMDGWKFRCKVYDNSGEVQKSRSCTLTVPKPPVITQQPQNLTLAVGEKGVISVKAVGTQLSYRWQYLDPNGTKWTNVNGVTSASWRATGQLDKNGRQYRCVIRDPAGQEVRSRRMTLTVVQLGAPTGLALKQNPWTSTWGYNVTASWEAVSGATGYKLLYDDGVTDQAPFYQMIDVGDATSVEIVNLKTGWLYAEVLAYNNTATSAASSEETLKVIAKPVITTQPQNITADVGEFVTISVRASGTGLTYQWQYMKPNEQKWNNCAGDQGKSRDLGFTTRATWNGRKYRCVITDRAGNVQKTRSMTLTVVVPLTIPELPKNVKAWALSDSEIAVSWDPVYNADGYYIYLTFEEERLREILRVIPDGLTGYTTVSGLKKSIYYDIKVIPYNDAGSLDPEDSNSYVSVWVGPPLAPDHVNVWSLGGGEYAVNWETVNNADGYHIYVEVDVDGDTNGTHDTYPASSIPNDNNDWYYKIKPEIWYGEEVRIAVGVSAYNWFGESDTCWTDI